MMYRKNQKVHMNVTDTRLQKRVLLSACALFLILAVIFGVTALRNGAYRKNAQEQFTYRMQTTVASAIDEVNRMSGMVTSNTSSRLARIRQYIYYMEQLNQLSMYLAGGESGRLAPDEAFSALNSDLDSFEALTQAATSSTLDVRTQLLNHLTTLQSILQQQ